MEATNVTIKYYRYRRILKVIDVIILSQTNTQRVNQFRLWLSRRLSGYGINFKLHYVIIIHRKGAMMVYTGLLNHFVRGADTIFWLIHARILSLNGEIIDKITEWIWNRIRQFSKNTVWSAWGHQSFHCVS